MNRRAPIALIVFVVALAIYLFTLAPTVALIDSGELTDAAWSRPQFSQHWQPYAPRWQRWKFSIWPLSGRERVPPSDG